MLLILVLRNLPLTTDVPIVLMIIAALYERWLTLQHHGKHNDVRDHKTYYIIFIIVLCTAFLTVLVMHFAPAITFYLHPAAVRSIGTLFVLCGLCLRFWSVRTLGTFFTVRITIQKDHTIINTGPYAFVRHPSYTAIFLYAVGIGLVLNNVVALIIILAGAALSLGIRMHYEEKELISAFGDSYITFAKTRSRVIPFVW